MDPQSTEYRITKTNTQAILSFILGILALIPAVLIVLLLPALVGLTAIAQQSDSAVLYRSLAVFWMLYMGMVCLFDFPLGMASLVTGILALASLRSSAGGKGKRLAILAIVFGCFGLIYNVFNPAIFNSLIPWTYVSLLT